MQNIPTVSAYRVFKNRKSILKNPLPFHNENFNKLGDIFKVKIGPTGLILFTRSPEFIKQILQKNHKKYHKSTLQTEDLAKYIGKGLLTSNGEHWRTHRRMVQPAFHKKKLEGLIGIMNSAIHRELERIHDGEAQDIYPLMGDLAFQVVAQSLFSRDDIQAEMAELKRITETNQVMLIKEMRQPYLNWWFKMSGAINRHLTYSKEARGILDKIIQERINSGIEKDDLLDMLLKARYEDEEPMSRDQLIDEVLILFTAGHETTANALSFTLFLLAQNEEVQAKAFESVSKVDLDDRNHLENIVSLQYVKQCVEEGMRLYPPAYYIDRMSIAEDKLGGHTIPKDVMILLAVYELHRDPNFWNDPEAFQPERFHPENKKDFSNYYYPFGAGPRMCVGNNFAMYEMILVVARILKKFRIEKQTEEVELDPLISLRPKEVRLRFIPR
ncbi:cytochrome P450 [Maribacter algarum]|uniref:Cytochrome P450 n=1 Tax=Maribacter algarum (ex Zhang et al. 2020) TaxID=2578118 RepID=A0A5S3PTF5_9FLAO|nr:cytochrome P450 [Maribacter algarum]TMM58275.1 cytochrome P450 [Maribacter algarum]